MTRARVGGWYLLAGVLLLAGLLLPGAARVAGEGTGEWDKTSLAFVGQWSNCDDGGTVFAQVRNTGEVTMAGPTGWELYYTSSGSPKNGSVVATGTIQPISGGGTYTMSALTSAGTGYYQFKAYQRPGHPGQGSLWSEVIWFNLEDCEKPDPTPTDTPEDPTPTDTPEDPTPTDTPEDPTPTDTPEDPTPTDTPEDPTPTDTPEDPTPTDTPQEPTPTDTPEAPTPTYTPESLPVEPIGECINILGGAQYEGVFAYNNRNAAVVSVPIGDRNMFSPGAVNRGQPTTFQPGLVTDAFRVVFDGSTITWKLGAMTASLSSNSVLCLGQEETPTPVPTATTVPTPTPTPPPEVPEPSSLALLGSGIATAAGYLALKRRRTDAKGRWLK